MRRVVRVGTVGAVLTIALAGCGSAPSESASTPPPPTVNPVDAATAGNVTGRVAFDGPAPQAATVRVDSDPNCVQQGPPLPDERVVVSGDGGLQNVFVYVKDGLGDLRFPIPTAPVVLDQQGCRYVPHVLGVQVGQTVEVLNSDPTLHNVHAVATANQEFNVGQPLPGLKHTHRFSTTEVMVPFKCDVHPWMHAYVGVVDHPYFAVTAADGSFALRGLPPGTYTIEAVHETLGRRSQSVTIGEKETKDVAFSFTQES